MSTFNPSSSHILECTTNSDSQCTAIDETNLHTQDHIQATLASSERTTILILNRMFIVNDMASKHSYSSPLTSPLLPAPTGIHDCIPLHPQAELKELRAENAQLNESLVEQAPEC